jgi:hypothetical protein
MREIIEEDVFRIKKVSLEEIKNIQFAHSVSRPLIESFERVKNQI